MLRLSVNTLRKSGSVIAKRSYAEATTSGALKLNFSLPHESLYNNVDVQQVNIPAVSGARGILANHVPTIDELSAGVVEVVESSGTAKSYFVSGGISTVQPESKLSITAVEAYPLDSFNVQAIKSKLDEAQKNLASSDENAAAEAAIEVEILTALQSVAK